MVDPKTFEQLLPLAFQWAQTQEQIILTRGAPLTPLHTEDARRVGVRDGSRVRVLAVERLPLPEDERLAHFARQNIIITAATRGAGIGHGILIRADCWGDRELLVHQLVHVAQCERSGGLESFTREYLRERFNSASFTTGPLEEEARRRAREICLANPVAT